MKVKTIAVALAISVNYVFGQDVRSGMDLNVNTNEGFGLAFIYQINSIYFRLGGSFKPSNVNGELVEEQLPNYGRSVDSRGSYYLVYDVSIGKALKNRWGLDGELSLGKRSSYTNYIDKRFTDGGYHMIDSEKFILAIGGNATYMINKSVGISLGVNTFYGARFGLRFFFYSNQNKSKT